MASKILTCKAGNLEGQLVRTSHASSMKPIGAIRCSGPVGAPALMCSGSAGISPTEGGGNLLYVHSGYLSG